MKFTTIATPLIATPIVAVSILGCASHALALPVKLIYADQAQGETNTGLIKLTVPRGYDLVLSFMKLGETITAVRLGDPSRIAFGSDGVLCPSNSSPYIELRCSATGASVIFFRQIQDKLGNGIPFPYLTSSADGSTQATIFTDGPKGKRMYPVLLSLGGSQPPTYTTVAIKPEEDKPRLNNIALPVRPAPEPKKFSQPPANNVHQPVVPSSEPTLKTPDIPADVQSEHWALREQGEQGEHQGKELHSAGLSIQSDSASSAPSASSASSAPSAQSINNATAFAFGLLEAIQSGRIKPDTLVWNQAQNALSWLRRGQSIGYALSRSQLSPLAFNYLLTLGQQESPLTKLNNQSNGKTSNPVAPSSLSAPPQQLPAQISPIIVNPQPFELTII